MIASPQNRKPLTKDCKPVADILLVRVSPAATVALQPDSFAQAETGREALGMLRLLKFHLLVASLDVPDMEPWELFLKARRAHARIRCVLLDERMTVQQEQRVREVGAAAFASNDPTICVALARSLPRTTRDGSETMSSNQEIVSGAPQAPARAPP